MGTIGKSYVRPALIIEGYVVLAASDLEMAIAAVSHARVTGSIGAKMIEQDVHGVVSRYANVKRVSLLKKKNELDLSQHLIKTENDN